MNKKTLFLLGIAFLVGVFAGSSMQAQRQQQTADALSTSPAFTAWDDFTQRMNKLGQRLLQDDAATAATGGTFPVASERDRAEAVRQLAHMIVEGIRLQFDHADTDFPSLLVINTDTTGWGGPNVDNKYLRTSISGDSTYRLTGNLSGVRDIAIQTSLGDLHMNEIGTSETWDKSSLTLDEQGNFTLIISPEPHQGDWLPLAADHKILSFRIYYADWEKDGDAELFVVKVGNEGLSPAILNEDTVAHRLGKAADWIEGSLIGWNRWMKAALIADKVNEYNGTRSVGGGSSTLVYGGIPFDLAEDEAMIIEVSPPPVVGYWSFQTYTHAWFDAGDYANRVTSLSMEQVYQGDDGKVWLVLAHQDPGIANWLDTEGRREAIITHRWMNAEGEPDISVQLVKFSELQKYLPAELPRVSFEQRRQQIATRQRHIQSRFHN